MFGRTFRKESGGIVVNGQHIASTTQCVHCGGHFIMQKGSGVKRGFCLQCNGVTCGQAACMVHIPYEVKLDYNDAKHEKMNGMIKTIESKYPEIKQIYI